MKYYIISQEEMEKLKFNPVQPRLQAENPYTSLTGCVDIKLQCHKFLAWQEGDANGYKRGLEESRKEKRI